jgi:hypothetical protein
MTLAVNIAQSGSNNVTMRNRIINGGMTISQRGTSFTNPGSFTTDRWDVYNYIGTTVASQSSTAPAGFVNSLLITNGTAASPSATFNYQISQCIEGFNIADLAWGTANAKSVTVSFWVQSSLTGTFGFALTNGGAGGSNSPTLPTRSYVTTYTISSANTWTYITITIAGDTSGTWNTNNSNGICVIYELGSGSNFQTSTTNAWQAGNYARTSSTVNLNATTGATFYITGVQLEAGTTASPFEYRQYGTELSLCYRYYYRIKPNGSANPFQGAGIAYTTSKIRFNIPYPVTMRIAPTALEQSGTAGDYSQLQTSWVVNSAVPAHDNTSTTATNVTFTSSAGFTTGYSAIARDETGNAYLGWSAEL